jgi:hypothetical protein
MTLTGLADGKAAGSYAVSDTKHITYYKTIIYAVRVATSIAIPVFSRGACASHPDEWGNLQKRATCRSKIPYFKPSSSFFFFSNS